MTTESLQEPIEQEAGAPEQADVEASAGEREQRAAEVMEKGQEQRAGLCKRMLTSELASSGLDLVPFVGSGKMLVESVAGSTLTGKDLTGKDRIIHAAIGAGLLALDFTGLGEAADAINLAGKSTALIGRLGTKLGEKGAARGAAMFAKTYQFMGKYPGAVAEAEKFATAQVRGFIKNAPALKKHGRA